MRGLLAQRFNMGKWEIFKKEIKKDNNLFSNIHTSAWWEEKQGPDIQREGHYYKATSIKSRGMDKRYFFKSKYLNMRRSHNGNDLELAKPMRVASYEV